MPTIELHLLGQRHTITSYVIQSGLGRFLGELEKLQRRLAGNSLDERDALQIVNRLRRVLGVAAFVLFAATWKLWTPHEEFPRVPLVAAALSVPAMAEWILAGLMLLSLGVGVMARESSRWWRRGLVVFSFSLLLLILCDQQRLQTWAYQFALMGPVLAIVPAKQAVSLLRLFVASIYLHSALSKMSLTFLNSAGPALVAGLLKSLQLPTVVANSMFQKAFEALLPIGEFTMAVLLLIRPTRWYGLWLSIFMHTLLLLALGPFGLNNRPGVLIWNIYFMLQNAILFGPLVRPHKSVAAEESVESAHADNGIVPGKRSIAQIGVMALTSAAILLPFLEPFGRFDHWPSWAVYAGSAERVKIYLKNDERQRLPVSLQERTVPVAAAPGWSRVVIDRWSLDVLSAPIYPEDRFQLGIALWIARQLESNDALMVTLESRAKRLTDERTSRVLNGSEEIEKELGTFWWNGYPREP